jgi:hypothetical protein
MISIRKNLVHIEATTALVHHVHSVPPSWIPSFVSHPNGHGNRMPRSVQTLPYVLPLREQQTVVLAGIRIELVRGHAAPQ